MMPDNDALLKQMFPEWMTHFRINLPLVQQSKCVSDLRKKYKSNTAIVIGAGPSLEKQIDLLKAQQNENIILICCDKALYPCLKKGLVPNIVTSIDSDKKVGEFFMLPYAEAKTDAVFDTFVHPSVISKWSGEKYFVNAHFAGKVSDPTGPDAMLQALSGKIVMNTGGNVGIFSFILAAFLECKTIALVGMDMSGHHEIYKEAAETWIAGLGRDLDIKVYNCTEGGNLYNIDGLKESTLENFLTSIKTI